MHCLDRVDLLLPREVLGCQPHVIINLNSAAVWAVQPLGPEADLDLLRPSVMNVEDIRACGGIIFIIGSSIIVDGMARLDGDVHLHGDLHLLLLMHWCYSFNIFECVGFDYILY